mgnify:CR=1 FL=1
MQLVSSAWVAAQAKNIVDESFIELTLQIGNQGTKTFTKRGLTSFSHEIESNLLSATIPINTISWTIDNSKHSWDITYPENYARFLVKASKITVRYGVKTSDGIEWIPGGVFYLSEWTTPANGIEASFKASSSLSYLSDIYTGKRSGTLFEIATEALKQMTLPNGDTVQYSIDDSLKELTADFQQDTSEYTCAEIVQLVANAGCCVMLYDRLGMIHIHPLSKVMSGYLLSLDKSYQYPEFELSKEIKSIEVSYAGGTATVPGSGQGNIQTVKNSLINTQERALTVGNWTATTLIDRKTLKASYRADPRLDVLDRVVMEHQNGQTSTAVITAIKYSFDGSWIGNVEGRILEPLSSFGYANESYSMDSGDVIPVLESEVTA